MSLWIGVGVMTALAAAFLLLPLWRAKPAARTLQSVVVLVLMVPATLGAYQFLGAPAILKEQALTQAQSRHDADAMVRALEDKLKTNPEDAEGWYALGRAYIAFQRVEEAEAALAKAAAQAPKNARILAQYAESVALKGGTLQGRAQELVAQALALDEEDDKALELAGLAAFQQEKWAESLYYWRRLMQKLPRETEPHDAIAQAVKIAEGKLAAGGMAMPEAPKRKR
jgi:cytochrome c-type biogenesis protein CcmH